MKPFLQKMYKSRAAAYRDSAQKFIDGYKEGFRETNQAPEVEAEAFEAEGDVEQPPVGQQESSSGLPAAAAVPPPSKPPEQPP
jgi:hypothetical protein